MYACINTHIHTHTAGKFATDGKFSRQLFGDEVGPQVEDMLSELDDEDVQMFDEDELPDLAFEIALDVGRKRRTYLLKKQTKKKANRAAAQKNVAEVKKAEKRVRMSPKLGHTPGELFVRLLAGFLFFV